MLRSKNKRIDCGPKFSSSSLLIIPSVSFHLWGILVERNLYGSPHGRLVLVVH